MRGQAYLSALGLSAMPTTQEELDAALAAIQTADPEALLELAPSPPAVPNMSAAGGSVRSRLRKLQAMINSFQYNHTGRKFLDLKKTEGMYRVSRTAKEIISQALPIKCVEACFLGAYLTVGVEGLTRLPIAFKSRVVGSNQDGDATFQHIVLAVAMTTKGTKASEKEESKKAGGADGSVGGGHEQNKTWGAIGLS